MFPIILSLIILVVFLAVDYNEKKQRARFATKLVTVVTCESCKRKVALKKVVGGDQCVYCIDSEANNQIQKVVKPGIIKED